MSNSDKDRGTGRTQCGVVQAVCAMLMGKTVRYISATPGGAKDAMSYAKDWLHINGWCEQSRVVLTADNDAMVILFGTGKLEFKHAGIAYNGGGLYTYVKDHFVLECEAEAASKKARTDAKTQIAKLMDEFGWECVQPSRKYTDGRREFWLDSGTKDEA